MKRDYRKGAVGAMMDEYERAAAELKAVIGRYSATDFERVLDPDTANEDLRSIQTIMFHVIRAGYRYADYIRAEFAIPSTAPTKIQVTQADASEQIDRVLQYTADTLSGHWEMNDEELDSVKIDSRWGWKYNLEQMLEHAIVHILRHRRQIERLVRNNEPNS